MILNCWFNWLTVIQFNFESTNLDDIELLIQFINVDSDSIHNICWEEMFDIWNLMIF